MVPRDSWAETSEAQSNKDAKAISFENIKEVVERTRKLTKSAIG